MLRKHSPIIVFCSGCIDASIDSSGVGILTSDISSRVLVLEASPIGVFQMVQFIRLLPKKKTSSEARSRLYRRRFLQLKDHFAAFFQGLQDDWYTITTLANFQDFCTKLVFFFNMQPPKFHDGRLVQFRQLLLKFYQNYTISHNFRCFDDFILSVRQK